MRIFFFKLILSIECIVDCSRDMASHACTHMHLPHAKVVERIKQLQDGRAKRHCSVPGCQAQASDLLVCLGTVPTHAAVSTSPLRAWVGRSGLSAAHKVLSCVPVSREIFERPSLVRTASTSALSSFCCPPFCPVCYPPGSRRRVTLRFVCAFT